MSQCVKAGAAPTLPWRYVGIQPTPVLLYQDRSVMSTGSVSSGRLLDRRGNIGRKRTIWALTADTPFRKI
jgi:hypothetical protein